MINKLLDWSEVWALLIPIAVLLKYPKQPSYLRPVKIYLFLALVLDIFIDIGYNFQGKYFSWTLPNNYLYNLHSIVRFICFSTFFILLKQPYFSTLKKVIPPVSLVLVVINFTFFENFFNPNTFSSRLFATESGILLFYCLQYILYKLQEETVSKRQADFWIVAGLSIYVVLNFPYFLFYTSLVTKYTSLVASFWNFHNVSFIVFCTFIARAFYSSRHD